MAYMQNIHQSLHGNACVLLDLAVIMLAGFLLTRLTRRLHLPDVSGYILAGILIGPHVLGLVENTMVEQMNFVSDIALGFIAFGVGRFFERDTLRETGAAVILITLLESLVAGALVAVTLRWAFGLELRMSLMLGAIATATAPASTVMTIRQYNAQGEFVNKLLQIVALDDVVCLLAFSAVAAWVNTLEAHHLSVAGVALPLAYNGAALVLGAALALVLCRLLGPKRSRENRLILTVAMVLAVSGACAVLDVSPLLSCMVLGAVYRNRTRDVELFRQLDSFTPPVMLLFFVVSGMSLDLGVLATFGLVGVAYFVVRIAGKYLGAWLGCRLTGQSKPLRRYMGMALVPQAGVAIGLAYLAQRTLDGEIGNLIMSIVLASSVLYELIGPACAKFALIRSGAISPEALEARRKGGPAEPEAVASGADGEEEQEGPAGEAAGFCHSR